MAPLYIAAFQSENLDQGLNLSYQQSPRGHRAISHVCLAENSATKVMLSYLKREKMYLLVHEIFAAKEQQDAKT